MQFRRRPPLDFRVEISPLIDVVFLLLIFFMVSSTFVEEAALEVELPQATSTAESPDRPLTIVVRADATIHFDGREMEAPALEQALRAALAGEQDRPVLVRGDEKAPHGTMMQVYDAIQRVGEARMVLDARPPEEPSGE